MATAKRHERIGRALGGASLLPSFAVAMLSAVAIVSDQWRQDQIWIAFVLLGLSAAICTFVMLYLLRRSAVDGLADVGVGVCQPDCFEQILLADRLVVESCDALRCAPLGVAKHQPFCDARLLPLMQAMAKHGQHPLCALASSAFGQMAIQAETIHDVIVGTRGAVRAHWRGHFVTLYIPAPNYGERQLSLCLCIDGEVAASYLFDEAIRFEAPGLLQRLQGRGVESVVLDPAPQDMLACAGRQLQVPIYSVDGQAALHNALMEQSELGYHILRLKADVACGALQLQNAAGEMLLDLGETVGGIWSAVQAAHYHNAAVRRGMMAVVAIHTLALGAFFAGGAAWLLASSALLISLAFAMPLRLMLMNRCRLLHLSVNGFKS